MNRTALSPPTFRPRILQVSDAVLNSPSNSNPIFPPSSCPSPLTQAPLPGIVRCIRIRKKLSQSPQGLLPFTCGPLSPDLIIDPPDIQNRMEQQDDPVLHVSASVAIYFTALRLRRMTRTALSLPTSKPKVLQTSEALFISPLNSYPIFSPSFLTILRVWPWRLYV